MSVTKDDFADEYGEDGAEFIAQAREKAADEKQERKKDETEDNIERAEALEAKRRLEQRDADESEEVHIEVSGEEIKMEAIQGLGEMTNLSRKLVEGERKERKARDRGDTAAAEEASLNQLIALDDMIDRLHQKTVFGDIFDREFWDKRDRDEIMDAHEDLALKSRGGEDAGN